MLSILTLNLRFGLADDGPNNWSYRKKAFPLLFRQHRPAFIGFQEANDFQTDFLKGLLHDYDVIGQRTRAPRFWQDNLIFYQKKWKCVWHEHFFLSPTPMIPSRSRKSQWPRQCTMGIFEKDGRQVICVNTHFDFDAEVQTESARIIMKQLSDMPSDLPGLIVGDFNATPACPCHAIFTGPEPGTSEIFKTSDVFFRPVFEDPLPATFHGFTGDTTGDHIDWILYRGTIALKNCGVIQQAIEGTYPSDHFPVHAAFGWEGS